MSNSQINKTKSQHNESAQSFPNTQENSYHVIDMEMVKKEGVTLESLSVAKSKDFSCIEIGEKTEESSATNEEVDSGKLAIPELKLHIISPAARQESTIKEFYNTVLDFGEQQRLAREIRRHGQLSGQGNPRQGHGYEAVHGYQQQPPRYHQEYSHYQMWGGQGQGYPPQGQGYPAQGQGYPAQNQGYFGQGYPAQGQGYPAQGQGYPAQNQGYYGQGYPAQGQGYPGQGYYGPGQQQDYYQSVVYVYDPQTRNLFVALVFAITFVMLLTTAIFVGAVMLTPSFQAFFINNGLAIFLGCALLLMIANILIICTQCGRSGGCGVLLLMLTVVAMSGLVGIMSIRVKTHIFFQAIIATTVIVAICTLLALTKFDFTKMLIYLVVFALVIGVVSMIFLVVRLILNQRMPMVHLGLLIVATLIECGILIAELQMILGGKTIELKEDEYILASFYLYTSVIDIFIKMLMILGIIDSS